MGAKTGEAKTEVMKVSISKSLREKCLSARGMGAHSGDAESTFLGYLIAVGLAKYEKAILPHETGDDEALTRSQAAGE